MSPGEGLAIGLGSGSGSAMGLGPGSAIGSGSGIGVRQPRQPLQPLLHVEHQLAPAQQQPVSQQKPTQQLPTGAVQPAPHLPQHAQQQKQEAQQLQQQPAHIPSQPMSILPNDAAVQQQQQAFGPEEDKQIAVQQAVSMLPDSVLPQQAPLIAESARKADSTSPLPEKTQTIAESGAQAESWLPDQAQARHPADSKPLHMNGSREEDRFTSSSQDADLSSATDGMISSQRPDHMQLPASMSVSQTAPEAPPTLVHAEQRIDSAGQTEQHTLLASMLEPGQSPAHAQNPPPALTPFSAQTLPKQTSTLSSLVPCVQQRPTSAGASAQTLAGGLGQAGRAPGAGPSREDTPMPRGSANWVHESTLPLWFVKTFEEKRRWDVAMVAARAAQQAQRDANIASRGFTLLGANNTWRTECKLC